MFGIRCVSGSWSSPRCSVAPAALKDRKSTRLNSSHSQISYAVFCLKKKNPYIFSGMPLLAAAQPGVLYPLNWFYLIFSPAAATNLMVVSSYIVAGLGAYLYARRIGTSITGSLLTALVWQFSGALVGQIAHINIVHNAAMLPWLLWSIESYAQTAKVRHGALLAGLLALQFFAGHQQTFAYSLILIAAYRSEEHT